MSTDLIGLVARDLRGKEVKATGREGLPAEAVLRCALLKQYRQLSYQELAFHLEDSASFRTFARLPRAWSPQRSALQRTISAMRPATWELINRALMSSAREAKLEDGGVVQLDSTVTAALMHEPSDSSLLWDAVRVMVRLLKQADGFIGEVLAGGVTKALTVETRIAAPEGKLARSGLLVLNPPYGFEAAMTNAAALIAPRMDAVITTRAPAE